MVILLNLESLYESLYDALNQVSPINVITGMRKLQKKKYTSKVAMNRQLESKESIIGTWDKKTLFKNNPKTPGLGLVDLTIGF